MGAAKTPVRFIFLALVASVISMANAAWIPELHASGRSLLHMAAAIVGVIWTL